MTVTVEAPARRRFPLSGFELLAITAAVLFLLRSRIQDWFDGPAVQTWSTIFVSISMQALPFLVLGVVLSGAIAAFVPPGAIERALPRRPALAVPTAGVAGVALPGCECGSVPIAGRLVASGAPPAAALTFLLAAPAVNPVVLAATAVAFPGQPEVVVARFTASMVTAVVVGWIWLRIGRDELVARARRRSPAMGSRSAIFADAATHDLLHAGGYLVLGAMTAATLQVVVPTSVLDTVASAGVLAVLALAVLAVVLAICSEADAFVAAGLAQFSLTARLAFLVVGPAVDVKLVALQSGTFGRAFAMRFAPLTFGVAVVSSVAIAAVLL